MAGGQAGSAKVALVTGAGSGIGRASAAALHRAGWQVVLADRSAESIAALERELGAGAKAVTADVTREVEVRTMIETAVAAFGRLDAVVNSAGVGPERWVKVADVTEAEWDTLLEIDVKGVWLCMKWAWPVLTRPGSVIINLGADCGLRGEMMSGALTAAKHAVIGLTRSAALEGEREGIRVNAVCPSRVDSPIRHESPAEREAMLAGVPYRRLISVEEVAAAIVYLASDDAAYLNGVALPIDGGMTAGMAFS